MLGTQEQSCNKINSWRLKFENKIQSTFLQSQLQ